MSWKKILKFQSDGLDQYNVDELLVHPIERLGFKLAKGHSYYHDVEGIFPGQFS